MSAEPVSQAPEAQAALRQFVTRLHFYIGLFVAPFLLVAALTGVLYVLTPQIETYLYRDQLVAQSAGPAKPLSEQIAVARQSIGPAPRLFAVRPAVRDGATTRVMFTEPGLGESETRTVFVDPASLAVQGTLITYGTSGVLPFRIALDYLHRNLLLGDLGRNYSELAASWLWIAVIGGVFLWAWRRRLPNAGKAARERRLHSLIGLWMSVGLVFLSVTGLTWSRWAGGNIDQFRNIVGWITPSITVELGAAPPQEPQGEHAEHMARMTPAPALSAYPEVDAVAKFDRVVAAAKAAGIDSPVIEIRPPRYATQAFRVSEYDRSWPTQVDTVAVDPATMAITSRADFKDFPIVAKLIRWGIDTHMGVLFGVANQLVMAVFGIALIVMIVYGYRMWWIRRPAAGGPVRTMVKSFLYLSGPTKISVAVVTIALGAALPALGLSLIVFMVIDMFRTALAEMMAAERRQSSRPGAR